MASVPIDVTWVDGTTVGDNESHDMDSDKDRGRLSAWWMSLIWGGPSGLYPIRMYNIGFHEITSRLNKLLTHERKWFNCKLGFIDGSFIVCKVATYFSTLSCHSCHTPFLRTHVLSDIDVSNDQQLIIPAGVETDKHTSIRRVTRACHCKYNGWNY